MYTQDRDRLAAQSGQFSRGKVKMSDVPIDLLYNREINKIKANEVNNVLNGSCIPVQFNIEHDSFAT